MLSSQRACVHRITLPLSTGSWVGGRFCLRTITKQVPKTVNVLKPSASPKITSVPAGVLSYYHDTNPPTTEELKRAEQFFTFHPPELLFVAGKFHQVKQTSVPEVAFLGRSNVGKSSLLNALMAKEICYTSRYPGRTQTMNGFAIGGPDGVGNMGRLTVLDMPGYGYGSHEEWGKEIMKYLVGRKEYARPVFRYQILKLFRHNAIPHQVILSKVDRVLLAKSTKKNITKANFEENVVKLRYTIGQILEKIQPKGDGPPALGEVLACSADNTRWKALSLSTGDKFGINAIRWAVLAATGLHRRTTDVKFQASPAFAIESEDNQTSSDQVERHKNSNRYFQDSI